MLRHHTVRCFLLILLLLAAVSCGGPLHWQNDIRSFVEDGLTAVLMRDYEYTAAGMQGGLVPSGTQTLVTLDIINPRELEVTYTLTAEGPSSLYSAPPVIVDSDPFRVVISFTPSLAAERHDLSLILSYYTPQTNRDHPSGEISLRCNTPPGAAVGVLALYDGLDRSFLRFNLPAGPTDDDLSRADIWYEPVDQSLPALTDSLDISGLPATVDYQPPGMSDGVPYRYRVTLWDSEGLHSETVQIANGQVFQVTYHDGGAGGGAVPVDGNYYLEGDGVTVQGNSGGLVRTGHDFAGWNTVSDGSGTAYAPGATFSMPASAVALHAQWSVNSYSVTYDGNGETGGLAPVADIAVFGTPVTVSGPESLEKTGHSFNGWNTAPDGSGTAYAVGDTFTMPAANMTLHAQWSVNSYSLIYQAGDATGGSPPAAGSFFYSSSAVVTGNTGSLERTHYLFAGWEDGGGTPYAVGDIFPMPAQDIFLVPRWTPLYSLTYLGNGADGGTAPAVQEYEAGTVVTLSLSGDLVLTGQIFSHWNTASDNSGDTVYPDDPYTMPAGDVTLYAIWVAGTDYDPADTGPSGGVIFLDKGHYKDGWRFMEAAPAPVAPATDLLIQQWGGYGTATGADLEGIGRGLGNTSTIIAVLGTGFSHPAMEADAYTAGGFSDWFLPSMSELTLMYQALHDQGVPLGGFLNEIYWSSTESSTTFARGYHFGEGWGYNLAKDQTTRDVYLRPARRF